MKLVASGRFGSRVKAKLAEELRCDHGEASGLIHLADAFDPVAVRAATTSAEADRALLCFQTVRGLFVSSWIGRGGVCFSCFERRWFANLSSWEHPADQERILQSLGRYQPQLRDFPTPDSTVNIAVQLLAAKARVAEAGAWCHHVDLVTCGITAGRPLPVHGCRGCWPDRAATRHTHGLAELAERLR